MSDIKNTKTLLEAVESKGAGIVIPMLDPKDLQIKMSAVVPPTYLDAIECDRRWSDRFKKQCDEVIEQNKDVLDFEDKDRFEGNKPVVAEKSVQVKDLKLTEATHAATAKPEGDKIKAFNNALRYAKKEGVPYCYGYTNNRLGGKFFAFDQPFKWNGDDKTFRSQYTNAAVIYVAYPDKSFVEESVKNEAYVATETRYHYVLRYDGGLEPVYYATGDRFVDDVKDASVREYDIYSDAEEDIENANDAWIHEADFEDELEALDGDYDALYEKFVKESGGFKPYRVIDEEGVVSDTDDDAPEGFSSIVEESLTEDTVKQGSKWVNKGKEGTHGEFKTKKEADAQRRAMYANGYGESLTEAEEEATQEEEVEIEPEAQVKIAFEKFKPWGNAVSPYNQIVKVNKLDDLEKTIENMYPEGIEDAELNDLLTDLEWLSAILGMKFKVED